MGLVKLEAVSIKNSGKDEKWVQDQLAADPTLLGLGDLELKDIQRTQPGAGRLDLLLRHPETGKRYEVEIQLGATDPSHIIRTIEYWDIERKRYPQYKHAAVIVAEDITSRFLNVIQVFNGSIPLIALKMTAYKVGENYALTFVKVLDEREQGLVDPEEETKGGETADRAYWEKRTKPEALQAIDNLLKVVREVEPKVELRYAKMLIGIKDADGLPRYFIAFFPRKAHILMSITVSQSTEADNLLDESGIAYSRQGRFYQLRIYGPVDDKQRAVLLRLIRQASDEYNEA
jgi:hypothetical protein